MKLNVSKLCKDAKVMVSKRSPEILTGLGIAGMITTTVLAVKATPKAMKLLEEAKKDIFDNLDPEDIPENTTDYTDISLKPIEMVKVAWKPYIPAAITGIASISCIIGASSVHAKRNAAIAAAYNLSQTALTEYKEKVVETIGEKKEQAIKDKIAKDKIKKDPVSKSEVIVTGKGNTLCYDAFNSRYFYSDIDQIKRAINELNRIMLNQMYVSLNDFYDELNLKHSGNGDELGWKLDDGFIEVDFSSQLSDDGRPCLVIEYMVAPRYDYSKLM